MNAWQAGTGQAFTPQHRRGNRSPKLYWMGSRRFASFPETIPDTTQTTCRVVTAGSGGGSFGIVGKKERTGDALDMTTGPKGSIN